MNPPQGNILVKVISSIGNAIGKSMTGKGKGGQHWMDVSKEEYGEELVEDVKLERYRQLLSRLPAINYNTLRRLVGQNCPNAVRQ